MQIWHWLERGTFVAGLLGLTVWLGSMAESALVQRWQNWVFEHELHGQPATFHRFLVEGEEHLAAFVARYYPRAVCPPARDSEARASGSPVRRQLPVAKLLAPDSSLVGRLSIPRLHLSAMVREGISERILRVALGHIPGTALPGTTGNVAVAGHRDRLFRPLRLIRRDDLIRLETLSGTYTYRVEKTEIVWPRNVSVLRLSQQPELTLVTCYPFYYVGAAPKRFVVRARQISANSTPAQPVPPESRRAEASAFAAAGGDSNRTDVRYSRAVQHRSFVQILASGLHLSWGE
jgi:sortase A